MNGVLEQQHTEREPGSTDVVTEAMYRTLFDGANDAIVVTVADTGTIIDVNPRATPGLKQELAEEAKRLRRVGHRMAEQVRYGERSTAERVNGGLKDNHGGRTVRVRGPDKVMCHLMFGILSFTVLQLVRLIT